MLSWSIRDERHCHYTSCNSDRKRRRRPRSFSEEEHRSRIQSQYSDNLQVPMGTRRDQVDDGSSASLRSDITFTPCLS